jgi:hypothetical protein
MVAVEDEEVAEDVVLLEEGVAEEEDEAAWLEVPR